MNHFYITEGFAREKSSDYDIWKHGFVADGLSDLEWRTFLFYYIYGNSEFRDAALPTLMEGKRWPDQFNVPQMATNKIHHLWSKALFRMKLIEHQKYRPQHNITRDPYVIAIFSLIMDMDPDYQKIRIPARLYNPTMWNWVEYCKTGEDKYLARYERLTLLEMKISKFEGHVLFLSALMAYTVDSSTIMNELYEICPAWNIGVKGLCGELISIDQIKSYIPKISFQWGNKDWMDPEDEVRVLEGPQPDKDFLIRLHEGDIICPIPIKRDNRGEGG